MMAFIDAHRGQHGVEPICRVLLIAPSTYFVRWSLFPGQFLGDAKLAY